jgi:Ca-activated chloride channel family protein
MTIAPIAPFGEIFAGIERKTLPLEELKVEATLEGLIARTTVRQTFVNNLTTKLEATYIFPLPDRAAVTAFRMRIGERLVDGKIMERGAAREAYEQAIEEGYRAGMAEEERPDVFTMTVGNIAPGEEITVELTLVAPLPWAGGEVTWQFPLVVAPRYIPGQPLAALPVGMGTEEDTDQVPDASRITPPLLIEGAPNPVRLSIEADVIDAGFEVGEPHSSLHAVMTERREGSRHIRVHPGERVDRDFILRYTLSQQTSTAVVHDGTFAITLLPPPSNQATQQPRDLVFVLDRSGSMEGWKIVAARRAIGRMIDSLTDADRFAVIPFSDRIIPVPGGGALHAATDRARFRAVEFLASLGAQGGTEMKDPLIKAAEMLRESRNGILVLVTDGQIGNEDAVLRSLSPLLGGTRVYAVGIDRSVNAGFLNRLAKGGAELVESEDRLDAVMDAMHRRIATPLITDVRVEGASDVIPSSAHLFEGAPLLLLGRSSDEVSSFVVRGTRADGSAWSATVPATAAASDAVTKIWARARVRALEDEYAKRSSTAVAEEIVATSLQYGVLSRFTAWLAIDTVRGDVGGEMAKIIQPVERAAGWDMLRSRTMAAGMAAPMAMVPPDESGVLYSMEPSTVFEYAPLAHGASEPSFDAEESLLQRLERTPTGDRRDAVRDAAIEIEVLAALHSSKRLERIAKLASHAETLDDQEFAKLWDELIEALREIEGGSPRRQRATRRREFWK